MCSEVLVGGNKTDKSEKKQLILTNCAIFYILSLPIGSTCGVGLGG